jgi:hypothetical protein
MRRALLLALAVITVSVPLPSHGRRQPAAGGDVVVALPEGLLAATREALLSVPLAEADDASLPPTVRATRPLIPGTTVRSHVLAGIHSADGGVSWTLAPNGSKPGLANSLRACLAPLPGGPAWPGRALAAAGVSVDVRPDGDDLNVLFSTGVSVLPELLTGCMLQDPTGPTGAFEPDRGERLVARAAAIGGRPMVDAVVLRAEDSPADVSRGDSRREGGALLVAPWPDVLLLILDEAARHADPLGLGAGDSLVRFQRELAPELLLAVRHGGRGAGARVLLPPGVGPDRPLPGTREPAAPLQLQLRGLPEDAPRLTVQVPIADPLATDVADRLALLLRARGWATDRVVHEGPTARIIRWRPPVSDAGLALLVLADRVPSLRLDAASAAPLLAGTASERTSAALTLERRWIAERRAVPLLTASRWLVLHARLRGVRVRGDGVPLLDGASWRSP